MLAGDVDYSGIIPNEVARLEICLGPKPEPKRTPKTEPLGMKMHHCMGHDTALVAGRGPYASWSTIGASDETVDSAWGDV